jgi:hypothetical protein
VEVPRPIAIVAQKRKAPAFVGGDGGPGLLSGASAQYKRCAYFRTG